MIKNKKGWWSFGMIFFLIFVPLLFIMVVDKVFLNDLIVDFIRETIINIGGWFK